MHFQGRAVRSVLIFLPWGRHVPRDSWIAGVPAFQEAPMFHQSKTSGVAGRAFARRPECSPGLVCWTYFYLLGREPYLLYPLFYCKKHRKKIT